MQGKARQPCSFLTASAQGLSGQPRSILLRKALNHRAQGEATLQVCSDSSVISALFEYHVSALDVSAPSFYICCLGNRFVLVSARFQ